MRNSFVWIFPSSSSSPLHGHSHITILTIIQCWLWQLHTDIMLRHFNLTTLLTLQCHIINYSLNFRAFFISPPVHHIYSEWWIQWIHRKETKESRCVCVFWKLMRWGPCMWREEKKVACVIVDVGGRMFNIMTILYNT